MRRRRGSGSLPSHAEIRSASGLFLAVLGGKHSGSVSVWEWKRAGSGTDRFRVGVVAVPATEHAEQAVSVGSAHQQSVQNGFEDRCGVGAHFAQ